MHILVAAAAEIADDDLIGLHFTGTLHGISDAVRRFERRHDTLDRTEVLKGLECFVIARVAKFDTAFFFIIRMLGADGGVVESGGDGVREIDLAVRAL